MDCHKIFGGHSKKVTPDLFSCKKNRYHDNENKGVDQFSEITYPEISRFAELLLFSIYSKFA